MASELLAKPDVRELVGQHEAATARELGLTPEKVLEGLRDALEMARAQNNPVAMVAELRESAKSRSSYFALSPALLVRRAKD